MCGIFGLYNYGEENVDLLTETIKGLTKLQHRGKDSCGISFYNKKTKQTEYEKFIGPVKDFTCVNKYNKDKVDQCIGHVRYSTSGKSDEVIHSCEVQPLVKNNISISHNGNIPNIKGHDTKHILDKIYIQNESIEESLIKIMVEIPACFCIIIMYRETMYVMKDRYGIRPLSYGIKNNCIYISSETIGLDGCDKITEVENGEILKISKSDITQLYRHSETYNNICSFEMIYFMNPSSYYKDVQIETIRRKLAKLLLDKEDVIVCKDEECVVVGVPNSGIVYGETFADGLSLKYSQVINKKINERTFISINNDERVKTCKKKFVYEKDLIEGKKIVILDDTIVRGNVMKTLISEIKKFNPCEIHIRIPSPPVIDKCQLGIAIRSKEELLMNNNSISDVKDILGVDSIKYLTLNEVKSVLPECYCEFFGGGIPSEITNYREIHINC